MPFTFTSSDPFWLAEPTEQLRDFYRFQIDKYETLIERIEHALEHEKFLYDYDEHNVRIRLRRAQKQLQIWEEKLYPGLYK